MDNQIKSVLISILISLIIFTPIYQFTIEITKPTQEDIEFCSQLNVVCDSHLPIIFIVELLGTLLLYFILQNRFENYLTLHYSKSVERGNEN